MTAPSSPSCACGQSKRRGGLEGLLREIKSCDVCKVSPTGASLPHEPRPVLRAKASARIAICGQAPGTRVHASGKPFTDPSGDRLRDWMGVSEDEFYDDRKIAIIPMGFCFPGLDAKGSDLPPRKECAPLWREAVLAHLPKLELLLLVGGYAQKWHLGTLASRTLTETVANWRPFFEEDVVGDGRRYLPLPHPSWRNNGWIKKNPWFSEELLPRLKTDVDQIVRR